MKREVFVNSFHLLVCFEFSLINENHSFSGELNFLKIWG